MQPLGKTPCPPPLRTLLIHEQHCRSAAVARQSNSTARVDNTWLRGPCGRTRRVSGGGPAVCVCGRIKAQRGSRAGEEWVEKGRNQVSRAGGGPERTARQTDGRSDGRRDGRNMLSTGVESVSRRWWGPGGGPRPGLGLGSTLDRTGPDRTERSDEPSSQPAS